MPFSAPTDRPKYGLPIEEALPALLESLRGAANAVLVAPPGAGKTSLVAPSLLAEPWLNGQKILLTLPRRLAARAAAERIASLLGESVGARVGYRTRLESRPGTHIECITEGLFVNRLLADPGLEGVGAVLFDEVHERNLEGDFALALALDALQLRTDLRIVAMSATLDGARFSRMMGDCAVVESAGRQYPVQIRYAGRSDLRIEDRMASAIQKALREEDGNILAFLPGVGEIERTAERLSLAPDVRLHKLHGQADPAAQRAALAPEPGRKLVLATAIAETSVTIDAIRIVIDSGLARRPRFDRTSGLTRLMTERVSQAAATQRAGRAGRQAPGIAIRLWEEGETRGFIPFDPPEILEADLSPMVLRMAAWGVRDPAELKWLDSPPASAVAVAQALLRDLGALDADGQLTAHGRQMARLPLAPRMAHMLLMGARNGQAEEAAMLAVLLEERGLGGNSSDIEDRLRRLPADRAPRAVAARKLAKRWADGAQRLQPEQDFALPVALLLAEAFPDRVARRRRKPGASDAMVDYLLANGRGASVETSDPLSRSEWLVVADAGGAGAASRIRLAAAIPEEALPGWLAGRTSTDEALAPDPASGRLALIRTSKLGAIEISRTRAPASKEAISAALLAEARAGGMQILPLDAEERGFLARLRFAAAQGLSGLPDVSEAGLMETAELWLAPRLQGIGKLADAKLAGALRDMLDWNQGQALDRFAPARFQSPAGTSHAIDYAAEGGPEVEVRVQAVFGLAAHPMLADGRVPLTLALTSPAGRPLAKTRDLPAFWKGAWRDVQKEMKGRYPRHPWPDDPSTERATVRTKAADARRHG